MIKTRKITAKITALAITVGLMSNLSITTYAADTENLNGTTTKQIDIVSFNDFHGSLQESGKNVGAAKLTTAVKEYHEADNASESYGAVVVSAGDLYQGSALSNLTEGAPVNDMLKEMDILASAIGNHEYDWGSDNISLWADDGEFDFVAANIVYEGTDTIVDYAEPYVVTETDGVKIAFIGIATPDTVTSTKAENTIGIEFLDPVETLNKWAPIVRAEGADVVIALTHCGASNDENGNVVGEAADIAAEAEDIDAVIAAHNHAFAEGIVNGRPVVEAGYNGRGLGIITLEIDENNDIVSSSVSTRKLYEETIEADATVAQIVADYEEQLDPILAEKVTDLNFDLPHDRYAGLSKLGVTVCEAMRAIGGTQIAIANGGGIRTSLYAGDVTVGDMYTILPFDNNLVTLELTGADLKTIIEHGINPDSFGWGQFSGIKVWYDKDTDLVTKMELEDGTEVKDDEYYTVTTIDFLITGGDYYDFSSAVNITDTCEVMREGIQAYWAANGIEEYNYDLLLVDDSTGVVDGSDGTTDDAEEVITPSDDLVVDEDKTNSNSSIEINEDTTTETSTNIDNNSKEEEDTVKVNETTDTVTNTSNNNDSLPTTGNPISSMAVAGIGAVIMAAGIVIYKREKNIA